MTGNSQRTINNHHNRAFVITHTRINQCNELINCWLNFDGKQNVSVHKLRIKCGVAGSSFLWRMIWYGIMICLYLLDIPLLRSELCSYNMWTTYHFSNVTVVCTTELVYLVCIFLHGRTDDFKYVSRILLQDVWCFECRCIQCWSVVGLFTCEMVYCQKGFCFNSLIHPKYRSLTKHIMIRVSVLTFNQARNLEHMCPVDLSLSEHKYPRLSNDFQEKNV